MSYQEPTAKKRLEILQSSKVVAMVGVSSNRSRASYFVASYLKGGDYYKVYYVNPMIDTLFDEPVYNSLADLPKQFGCSLEFLTTKLVTAEPQPD
jgi:uncharacterized protein